MQAATLAGMAATVLIRSASNSPACRGGQGAAEVLFHHGHRAAEQVAQVVGKIRVDAIDERLVGEDAVVAEGMSRSEEIADGVDPVAAAQDHRVHHVALGFGHFAPVQQHAAVAEHPLGRAGPAP